MKYKFIGAIACIAILLVGSLNWNLLFGLTTENAFISIYLMCQNKNASKPIMTASFALTSRLFLLIQTVRKYREKE